jgi:hypothetical protein
MLWAPILSAAKSVVAEPANGSRTCGRDNPDSRIVVVTHSAEKPALKRNHLCTGSLMLSINVEEASFLPSRGAKSSGKSRRCNWNPLVMPFLQVKRVGVTPMSLQPTPLMSAGLRFQRIAHLVHDLGHGNDSSKIESGREA